MPRSKRSRSCLPTQLALQKLENEVSTGQALNLPSDNPIAALDAVNIQRTLDQLTQVGTNLTTNQSYLAQTDSTLSSVANLLTDAQSTASSAAGTTISASQQQEAANQIGQLVQQLVQSANTNYDGRYLFAGSTAGTQPFVMDGQYVEYVGNSGSLSSYSDVNQLFQTNVSGAEAFGALSTSVQGTANLTPTVTADTPLADLNGGQGVAQGSIVISDGTNSSVVNLSGAATVGDVAADIEANPPAGRTVTVSITPTGPGYFARQRRRRQLIGRRSRRRHDRGESRHSRHQPRRHRPARRHGAQSDADGNHSAE